jgi:hypothetical protein
MSKPREHVFIPDTQVKPGVPLDHLEAASNYICSRMPDVIVLAGDWYDMHSLSVYDVGRKAGEGARYQDDIDAGYRALELFFDPIKRLNKNRKRQHLKVWKPEIHVTLGNHENRVERHVNSYPILDGKLSVKDFRFEDFGITVHPFLQPVELDGILYAHYFPRNSHGAVLQTYRGAPSASAQVKREFQSATAGHKQGLDIHVQQTLGGNRWGIIAGSFYMHDEDYLGPQATEHWKGIVYKHQVKNGDYDPMFVSMKYLLEKWL